MYMYTCNGILKFLLYKLRMHFLHQQLQSISDEVTDEDRSQIERNKALSKSNRNDADIPGMVLSFVSGYIYFLLLSVYYKQHYVLNQITAKYMLG